MVIVKHIMKKSGQRASCQRLGCMASITGAPVLEMSQKELDERFQTSCPGVIMDRLRGIVGG